MTQAVTTATTSPTAPRRVTRAQAVWGALLASMTIVGGGLMALQGGPAVTRAAQPLAQVEPAKDADRLAAIFKTNSPIEPGRWQGIVIHHSGSGMGSAESITQQGLAKGVRSLGYHFVIGNGQGAPDGQIHVGPRWLDQLPGAHTAGPKSELYNRTTIGICLVGDGERRPFTDAQVASLVRLVAALQKDLAIDDEHVYLHRDVAPTASPGRLFPEAMLRARLAAAAVPVAAP